MLAHWLWLILYRRPAVFVAFLVFSFQLGFGTIFFLMLRLVGAMLVARNVATARLVAAARSELRRMPLL
jgi:uncharacterized membrane protein